MTGNEPIEDYLDGLTRRGAGLPPRALRHLLAETEAHLRDAAATEVAAGLSEPDAERRAVERFGPVDQVIRAERAVVTPLRELALQTLRSGLLLGGLGAVAVGLSGVIAAVIRAIGGDTAVSAVRPGQALSPSDCARWLRLRPHAGSCRAAAAADWADETVYYRVGAGLLGVLAVVVALILIRRARSARVLLDRRVTDTIGAGAFGAAAVWTLGMGLDTVVVDSGGGSGQWLSAAPIAAAAALFFLMRLVRELRASPPIR